MTLPERARALAASLSASRTITPYLTDDVATLTVIFDAAAILAALEATRREALEEAARTAERLTNRRSMHAIRAMIDQPKALT